MKLIADLRAHPRHATALLFSPDGHELVTTGMDALAQVWAVPTWEPLRTFLGHEKSVNGLAFSPDGAILVTGSTDRTLRLWDYATGQPIRTLTGHTNTVTAPRFSPDGRWIASPSYDATVRLWPASGEGAARVLKGHPKNVTSVAFTADSRTLASAGLGDDIFLWDVASGEQVRRLQGHRTAVMGLQVSPDGEHPERGHLWSLGYEGSLKVWSAATWTVERSLDLSAEKPLGFTLSSDGSRVAVAFQGAVGLLEASTFQRLATEKLGVKGVYCVVLSPDGSLLAAASADGHARVWDITG